MCDIAAKDERPAEILDDPRVSQLSKIVIVTQEHGRPLRTRSTNLRAEDVDRMIEFYESLPFC
jgi:hypothetical protein